jgi:hypothetical protein
MEDIAAVQAALRLTDLREGTDAIAILEQGIRMARVRFYTRLGASTVQAILDTDYAEDPTTEDEMKRFVGNLCEVELVRLQLMDRMPLLFMDASGAARETYNNEGAFRSMDRDTLMAARLRIEAQVEEWLSLMAGDVVLGEEAAQAYTQQNVCPKPVLGATVFIGEATINPGTFDGNFIADDEIPLDGEL